MLDADFQIAEENNKENLCFAWQLQEKITLKGMNGDDKKKNP